MPSATHQTTKLSRGKHRSADEGACVMELASMLAGERFSDHPLSVSPTIAALLRTYNDHIDDRRRQALFEYAARAVDTLKTEALERLRRERLNEWIVQLRPRWRRLFPDWLSALGPMLSLDDAAAVLVRRSADWDQDGRSLTLWIVDELLAMSDDEPRGGTSAHTAAIPGRPLSGLRGGAGETERDLPVRVDAVNQ